MKRVLFVTISALMLLVACQNKVEVSQNDDPQCNVDPDSVFGAHYTADDFGIWYVEDFGSYRYQDLVHIAMINLPQNLRRDWENYEGLLVPASDTAAYTHAIECNMDEKIEGERYFWDRLMKDGDTLYRFLCVTRPIIDGSHIDSAWVDAWKLSTDVVWQFDSVGTEIFRQVTNENVGRFLAILLGDRFVSAPMVNCEISGGRCAVTGLTSDEMCALVKVLNNKK